MVKASLNDVNSERFLARAHSGLVGEKAQTVAMPMMRASVKVDSAGGMD